MVLAASKRQEQVTVKIGQQVKFLHEGAFHFGIVTRVGRKLATVKYGAKKSDFQLKDLVLWEPREPTTQTAADVKTNFRGVKRARSHK